MSPEEIANRERNQKLGISPYLVLSEREYRVLEKAVNAIRSPH